MNSHERHQDALREELEQRITILENTPESEFGEFTRFDWVVMLLFGVVFPVILVVVAR